MTRDNRTFGGGLRLILTISVLVMPWLLGGCAGTASLQPPPASVDSRPGVEASVREASARFNMPVTWINAVMRQESGGRAHVVSSKGAMGLMQLMPGTWNYLRTAYKLGNDPYDPHDNIIAGTAYLREMYDQYGSPGFLAAYNAGPGRYESCVRRHRPLPAETRHYVAAIAPKLEGAMPGGASPTRPLAVASLPPALLEVASLEPTAHVPPPVPAQRAGFGAAAFDDDDEDAAPRPARSPVAQTHAAPAAQAHATPAVQSRAPVAQTHAAPAKPVAAGRAAEHRLPEHRPPLPPGWYVPVAYANR